MIAMGRLCDPDGNDTWRLIILDCITPCFRSLSTRISRDFQVEREDLQSAMVTTALEVWEGTVMDTSPRHIRDRMVKATFDLAFQLGNTTCSDFSVDDVGVLIQPDWNAQDSALRASSIDVNTVRDADVAEQLRGERIGALLHVQGHSEVLRGLHEGLRDGSRSGSASRSVRSSEFSRSRISNPNLYYCISDLYPSFIGL
ncbi:hypothetical protein [Streptomyces dioscori]|uniref:hypothetical protein n=1 Tax=Streptomyces dioscori TaxID=2109333 RepID=UPI00131E274C|nr:hypothetical protein [Streptomyces dioscori]